MLTWLLFWLHIIIGTMQVAMKNWQSWFLIWKFMEAMKELLRWLTKSNTMMDSLLVTWTFAVFLLHVIPKVTFAILSLTRMVVNHLYSQVVIRILSYEYLVFMFRWYFVYCWMRKVFRRNPTADVHCFDWNIEQSAWSNSKLNSISQVFQYKILYFFIESLLWAWIYWIKLKICFFCWTWKHGY